MTSKPEPASTTPRAEAPAGTEPAPKPATPAAPKAAEVGGRKGLDPTRYGDWEKDGRCVDF